MKLLGSRVQNQDKAVCVDRVGLGFGVVPTSPSLSLKKYTSHLLDFLGLRGFIKNDTLGAGPPSGCIVSFSCQLLFTSP